MPWTGILQKGVACFLRLLRVELPNGYKGMALFMDRPMATPRGNPSAQEQELMYEHAVSNAAAIGVPLMMGHGAALAVVQERGFEMKALQANIFLHKGETGLDHNENLGPHYHVAWARVAAGHAVAEAQPELLLNKLVQVVMSADFKPAGV